MITLIVIDIIAIIVFEIWRSAELIRLRTDAQYLANKRENEEYERMREEWHDMRNQLLEAVKCEARHEVHANISDVYMKQLTGQQAMSPVNYLKNAAGQIQPAPIQGPKNVSLELIQEHEHEKTSLKMIQPAPGVTDEEPEPIDAEEPESVGIPLIHAAAQKTVEALTLNEDPEEAQEQNCATDSERPPITGKIKEILTFELDALGVKKEDIAALLNINERSVRVYKRKGMQHAPAVFREEKKYINRNEPSFVLVDYHPCRPTEEKTYFELFRQQFDEAMANHDAEWLRRYYLDYVWNA